VRKVPRQEVLVVSMDTGMDAARDIIGADLEGHECD
jgi:hypothetical protein